MKIPTPDEFAKQHGYHPFPGKWNKWLSAAREAILSAQPVAGRHVSIDEHPGKGTVINVERKPGASPTPGCAGCALPGGDCPHALGITIEFDNTESDNESDFLEFIDAGENSGIGMFYFDDGANQQIEAYAWGAGGFVDIPIPTASFFNVPISICVQFSRIDNMTVNVDVSISGYGSGSFTMDTPTNPPDTLYVGARSNSQAAHRLISCVGLLANPANTEEDFNFPTDSFDSINGNASIIGAVLVVNDNTGIDSYAEKTLFPSYDLDCATGACCFDDLSCTIETESDCENDGGDYQGNGTVCDPNPCCTCENFAASYSASGSIDASFSGSIEAGSTRSYTGTESFSVVLTVGTPQNIDSPCLCTSMTDCNVIDDCPDNFVDCPTDICTPDVGDPFQACVGMLVAVGIYCFNEGGEDDGWYFNGSIATPNFCGGQLVWATSGTGPLGPQYAKFANLCDGPTGSFSLSLIEQGGLGGSASISFVIS